jgi:hypothetical protein
MNDKPKPAIELVTLKQLCTELKVDPREARERLRLAVRAQGSPEAVQAHRTIGAARSTLAWLGRPFARKRPRSPTVQISPAPR